jgi:hypothetical protein
MDFEDTLSAAREKIMRQSADISKEYKLTKMT